MGTEIKREDELLWADVARMMNPLNSDSFMDPLAFASSLLPDESQTSSSSVIASKVFGFCIASGQTRQSRLSVLLALDSLITVFNTLISCKRVYRQN